MYNQYLDQAPVDVTPKPVEEPPAEPAMANASSSHNNGLFSLLSGVLNQRSGRSDLLSSDNLIVLAALAFLVYNGEELDTELLALAVLFLLIGL